MYSFGLHARGVYSLPRSFHFWPFYAKKGGSHAAHCQFLIAGRVPAVFFSIFPAGRELASFRLLALSFPALRFGWIRLMKLEYMQQNHFMSGGLYHKIIAWEWAVPRKCCINGRMLRKIVAKVGTLPKNQIKNLINSHGVERFTEYNFPTPVKARSEKHNSRIS